MDKTKSTKKVSKQDSHDLHEVEVLEILKVAAELRQGDIPLFNIKRGAGKAVDSMKKGLNAESYITSDELLSEATPGELTSTIKNKFFGGMMQKATNSTYENLKKAWEERGKPTTAEDVIRMLKREFKYSDNDIRKIVSEVRKRSPYAKLLAQDIKKAGLEKEMLQYAKDLGQETTRESLETIEEKKLADRDIKTLFYQIASGDGSKKSNKDIGLSTENMNEYIKLWAKTIKSTQDKNEKYALVKKIVNFLQKRHGTPEWRNVAKGVQNIIKDLDVDRNFSLKAAANIADGKTMESSLAILLNDFLLESEVSWSDLSVKLVKLNDGFILKRTLGNRDILLEDFFENIIIHDRVQKITLGRRKKG